MKNPKVFEAFIKEKTQQELYELRNEIVEGASYYEMDVWNLSEDEWLDAMCLALAQKLQSE